MVLIAVPLHMHAPVALAAMAAGKHVFCEKLMAWSVADCKKMCRASAGNAKDGNKLQVAIGHQRHYSVLYDHAVELIQGGVLGDIRHIRARWHRNNTFPGRDGWKPDIPDGDKNVDIEKYGYKSLNEMIRWRLYDRTGGGLMAELGSHQLDACSIFLGKIHPTAVQGVGGKYYYNDEREIADHVYVMFEFEEANNTVVNYSSINTNRYDDYGEIVYGTRGTLLLERETQAMLFKENDPNERNRKPDRQTAISVSRNAKGDPAVDSHGSPDPMAAASAQVGIGAKVSRGYREELEHLAYCIRNPDPSNTPKCHPKVALTDAVIALTSNLAMKHQTRIVFKDAWFDPDETAVPEDEYNGSAGQVAGKP
jgi:predicted dehydrogenase